MLRQYFTLHQVARELNSLAGMHLKECYTQEKNSLILLLENEDLFALIECSIDPQWGTMFIKNDYNRARRNTLNLFPAALGQRLLRAAILPNERIITLQLEEHRIHCIFFGGGKGNIIVTDSHDNVVDAFKSPKKLLATVFRPDSPTIEALNSMPGELPVAKALSTSLLLPGKEYPRELCLRRGIDARAQLASLSAAEQMELESAARELRDECLGSRRYYIYRNENGAPLLSLIRLHDSGEPEHILDSISDALLLRIRTARRERRYHGQYAMLAKALKLNIDKIQKALRRLEDEGRNEDRAQQRQLFGELLVAHGNLHAKGLNELTLVDWNGASHVIPLLPELSVLENANRFFDKAKNSRQARVIREQRYFDYLAREEELQRAAEEFQAVQDLASLQSFINRFPSIIRTMSRTSQQEEQRFRTFELGEGFTLYVGRNSANNDELTMRFAKPQDYWLHARGVSGSHAVIKGPDKDKPPKYIIKQAAAIAAYYSKARNAGLTPVVYTQKKYIRKPKGSAPGAVVLERETVVMVRPQLMEEN